MGFQVRMGGWEGGDIAGVWSKTTYVYIIRGSREHNVKVWC